MELYVNDRRKVRRIEKFNNFSFKMHYDSVASTFSLQFYFDENNPDHKELACVSHYHECHIEHNGERLMTGFILSQKFTHSPEATMVNLAGYSKAGVLGDCKIPLSLYPLQIDNQSLKQIATKIASYFKLKVIVDELAKSKDSKEIIVEDDSPDPTASPDYDVRLASLEVKDASPTEKMDKNYKRVKAAEKQTALQFLADLAFQRNIVMTHNENGDILFTVPDTNQKAVSHFEVGINATNLEMTFDGQKIHSHHTAIKEAPADGGNNSYKTIRNPLVPIVYRPTVIIQNSGDDQDTLGVAQAARAEELRNITLDIDTAFWELQGKIIRPGSLITAKIPQLYLYKKAKWFVESVEFKGDSESLTASMRCVLPCCYDNSLPINIFVDPHKDSA